MITLTIIFLSLLLIFGGGQGVRGLLSLGGSLFLIIYFLMPNILGGMSPVLVSVIAASLIIILGSYITHGFNRTTSAAVLSMIITVVFTGILAKIAVNAARLSGNSEEAFFLNLKLGGEIDLVGILMGGIIIGLLGVLYDVAISQAISVEELFRFIPNTNSKMVYKRAIRMGREHIGALVNTLAIAYVGASLPLFLLLFSDGQNPFLITVNQEIISAEIIRTLVGTIGIILAVPITTLIAIYMLTGKIKPEHDPNHHFDGHSHHKH